MICSVITESNQVVLKLEGALLVTDITAVREEVMSNLNVCIPVVLDVNGVTDIDTSGLQILLSIAKSATTACGKFTMSGVCESLVDLAAKVGVSLAEYCGNSEESANA